MTASPILPLTRCIHPKSRHRPLPGTQWVERWHRFLFRLTVAKPGRFGSSSDVLYVSALRNQIRLGDFKLEPLELVICRSSGFANAWVMDEVAKRQGEGIDQPYITATTAANQKDRVFVGVNDFNGRPRKKTATIDRSLDGTANSFIPILIESRTTFDRDGAEIRPAISSDGNVVYAAFNHVTREHDNLRIADVVVVRDDNGGDSTLPFTSLVDCDDGFFGMRVVKERTFAWDLCLGNDRLGGDRHEKIRV